MKQTAKQDHIQQLFELITSIDNVDDCRALFDDLCTIKEVENMAERCHAAKLLLEGNTYNQVMAQADISSATLSRVSRCVQYGKGYSKLLKDQGWDTKYSTVPPWLQIALPLIDALTGAPDRAFLPDGSEVVSIPAVLQMPCTKWHPLWESCGDCMSSSQLLTPRI